jgi:hypothetical protein
LEAYEDSPQRAAKREQRHAAKAGIKRDKAGKAKPDHADHQGRRPFDSCRLRVSLRRCGCHDDIEPEREEADMDIGTRIALSES